MYSGDNGNSNEINTVKYTKLDTDSSSTPPPPPEIPYPGENVVLPGDKDTSDIKYMSQNEMEQQGYQPQTPQETPLMTNELELDESKYEPHTPLDSPPQELNVEHQEKDEEENKDNVELNEEKNKQLEMLKQTYVDITKKKMNRQKNIFNPVIDTEKIILKIHQLDKNYNSKLKQILKRKLEEKCNKHGFIKKDSVNIISISSTTVYGSNAEFYVTYQALSCNPVEGTIVEASILNITKAGVRAELINYDRSPLVIFIARDHHHNSNYFNRLKDGEVITVEIIGVRYELNDTFISAIGKLQRI